MSFPGYIPLIMLLIPVVVSCSDRPEGVASEKKMVRIMTDMEMAEAYLQGGGTMGNTSETRERILEYILQKNDMTRAEFDSTMTWYGKNIDEYTELYGKVDKALEAKGRKISGNIEEVVLNDLWPYTRHITISPLGTSDNIVFDIPVEDVSRGERIQWRMRTNSSVNANLMLGVKYADGQISYFNQTMNGRNQMEIVLQTDTSKSVDRVYGNLVVTSDFTAPIRIDSISLSAMPLDTMEYYKINMARKYRGPASKIVKKENESADSTSNNSADSTKLANGSELNKATRIQMLR